ncbi:MAG TPA: hypothetical protein PK298_16415, partial [Chitinophagaceae bacterium]|nr:hypothetical protein [Chitinophagaceae bacterium]
SANTYNGNTSFTATNSGGLQVSNGSASSFNGNLTVNRTATGPTQFFNAGAVITGNFSYTNNNSGASTFGNTGFATTIGGTVNIAAIYTASSTFAINRLINQTAGGTINIQNTTGFDIRNNTLKVISLSVTGYKTGQYGYFLNNAITGNVTIADDATYGGGFLTQVRNNIITGNSSFTINGSNSFYDSDGVGTANKYTGNLSYTKAGSGAMFVGTLDTVSVSQNFTLNSTAGITLSRIRFNGATDGIVEQLGTQAIIISETTMEKTGTGKITLNDSVTVTTSLSFGGGNIISSNPNHLIFLDNATYAGALNTSHVVGPVSKIGNDAFTFPIGTPTSLNTVAMTAPANASSKFSAQHFKANPSLAGYDTSLHDVTLQRISGGEYWDVQRLNGTSTTTLTFSFEPPCATGPWYISNPAAARIARWTATTWENLGNGGSTGTTTGTITTAAAVNNFGPFTFGSVDILINPLAPDPPPTVAINQAAAQPDPTSGSPINFTVVFNEPVTGFATGDVTLSGTAGATTAIVTGSGTTYNVAVSGMTGSGTVIATIAAGVAIDAGSNLNIASTSTDNTVTYDTPPTVTINQAAAQPDPTSGSPINFTVVFNE